ncbi:MAG: GAF domain-containing protein [Desulfobacterales bacterium]|nr:GAF domain-containing protein [Desulfobacterales bacterium]
MESSDIFKDYFGVFRDIIRMMHTTNSLEEVLNLGVQRTSKVLNAKGALVRLLNKTTQQLEVRAAWGMDKCYLSKGPVSSDKLLTWDNDGKKIHIITDILNAPQVAYPQHAWDQGVRMMLDVPLTISFQMIGFMRIYLTEPRYFSDDELDFMITVAEQFACIIERLRLMENQKAHYNHLALHMEKMSSMGRMAAGIAHEINNPLAGILLYSSNLIKKVPPQSPLEEGLQIIMTETQRCKVIIQGLLEFSRDNEPQKVPANVNDILDKALSILNNEFFIHHIRIDEDLENNLPLILLDADQIEQVLINILLNAAHAIEKDGIISIKTCMDAEQAKLSIEITDNGRGITEKEMSKIFDPFFSTKPSGTGLGLAVSYGIIRNHEGDIRVESRAGKGSCFTIDLPILPEASGKAEGRDLA